MKGVLTAKRLVAAVFLFAYYPARIAAKFVFYRLLVKIYGSYLTLSKKLGLKDRDIFTSFLNQKLVHVAVLVFTMTLLAVNISTKTRANAYTEKANNTIIFDLIKGEFDDFDEEDQRFIVESFDKEAVISAAQQSYLDNLGAFRPQAKVNMNSEEEDDFASSAGDSLVRPELATTNITKQPRKEAINYTVQPGDTISTIAAQFDINVSTVLWENNLTAYSIIRPGDRLSILPASGVRHDVKSGENLQQIAKKYDISQEKIAEANGLDDAAKLSIGQKLFIPDGRKIAAPVTATARAQAPYTGISAIKDIVKPADAKPAANKMNWPTVGSRITQYYSWKHTGLDVADKIGTAIYAADAGTIESAGWGTGYGNQIVVDHGGGKKTRYAHLSKFYVKKGDKVTKGQTIGGMGSTGWSTGSHLHFEVIINGVKYNPLNYIR